MCLMGKLGVYDSKKLIGLLAVMATDKKSLCSMQVDRMVPILSVPICEHSYYSA